MEFNYQLLQSYDFLELYRRHGCRLQIGGDDQWGNIVAGMELIRRVEGAEAFGLTFPLVMTRDGKKMGKTEKGALFLDPAMTSPYEFFQYWRERPRRGRRAVPPACSPSCPAEECRALAAPGRGHQRRQGAARLGSDGRHPRQGRGGQGPGGRQGRASAAAATETCHAHGGAAAGPLRRGLPGPGPLRGRGPGPDQERGPAPGPAGRGLRSRRGLEGRKPRGIRRPGPDGEPVLRAGKKRFCRIVAAVGKGIPAPSRSVHRWIGRAARMDIPERTARACKARPFPKSATPSPGGNGESQPRGSRRDIPRRTW
ncbi:MAG: hypothetical protein MZU95_09225 [Desulfomicrobium escambiense]|nr:hypothetical protein [Desulfomicrobium escambiense]